MARTANLTGSLECFRAIPMLIVWHSMNILVKRKNDEILAKRQASSRSGKSAGLLLGARTSASGGFREVWREDGAIRPPSNQSAALQQDVVVIAPQATFADVAGAPEDKAMEVAQRIHPTRAPCYRVAGDPPADDPALRHPV